MITYIKISGFKSFHNFEMEFTPFTVIAGANASGKSNLFDALQLLSRLAETDLKTAFNEQRGNPNELFTQYNEAEYASEMEFIIEILVNVIVKDKWGSQAKLTYTRLQYQLTIKRITNDIGIEDLLIVNECLKHIQKKDDRWMKTYIPKNYLEFWQPKLSQKGGGGIRKTPYIETKDQKGISTIIVSQDGTGGNSKKLLADKTSQTILSQIDNVDFPHILAAKEEMKSWQFLQLNPEDLREPTRQDIGLKDRITQSGKNLAAALFRIKQDDEYNLREISRTLNNILPNLTEVNVYNDKANKQFIIKIKGEDEQEFSSRVLSEGTLRLLALCILQHDRQHTGLLCFEEPENGIHPFRIKTMAMLLKDLSVNFKDDEMPLRQVIVNTHSPVLVSQLIQWKDDKNVSIWLSKLNTLIAVIEGEKRKIKVTKNLPVVKEDQKQLSLIIISEQERKYTLNEVIEYLKTADSENSINVIKLIND